MLHAKKLTKLILLGESTLFLFCCCVHSVENVFEEHKTMEFTDPNMEKAFYLTSTFKKNKTPSQ